MQLELIDITQYNDELSLLSTNLIELINIRILNKRLEAGKIIIHIKDNKLFKTRYKSFKAYCDNELMIKSTRVEYIAKFYKSFKELEKHLSPLPVTIDQVKELDLLNKELSKELWELVVIRFNNNVNNISGQDIHDLKLWILGHEPLKLKQDDNRNFLKQLIKTQAIRISKYKNQLSNLSIENKTLTQGSYNKAYYENSINDLQSQVNHYKSMYELEHYINQSRSNNSSFNAAGSKSSYDILGLKLGCSKSDIKKAFRTLSLEYHPDKLESMNLSVMQKSLFSAKFQELKTAYDNLYL